VSAGLFTALFALSFAVHAQAPLRIVVPFPPGGGLDAVARLLAQHLGALRGESVLVENRPGADALIAVQYVANAAPDGRTLLMGATFLSTNVVLHRFNFDPQTDLMPVIMTSTIETVLGVNAGLHVHSVEDIVKLSQSRPAGINCGAAAGLPALACEQLRGVLKGNLTLIPYAGLAAAANALAAGHVDVMLAPRAAMSGLADSGKVRFIAGVEQHKLAPPLDQLPLLKDTWPSMHVPSYNGVFAPAGTPPELISALNRDLNRVLSMPAVRSTLRKNGHHVAGGSPEVLGRDLADSIAHVRRVADQLGIRPAS
jgi:tripartite-type tricarboxylate transporter receptor subunit TctC